MNSFAIAKLTNLETREDYGDDSQILGHSGANLSDDITDRVIRFDIGIRVPGSYKILISLLHDSRRSSEQLLGRA